MSTLKLAFRNILRNRRRSLLTALSASVAVLVLVVATGFIGGVETDSVKSYLTTRTAHIKVYAAGYPYNDESLPLDQALSPAQQSRLVDAGRDVGRAVGRPIGRTVSGLKMAPRLLFSASLIKDGEELMALGAGVDPQADPAVLEAPGRLARRLTDPRGILVGSDLARLLHLKAGDTVTASFRTRPGTIYADDFTILGLVDSGNPEVDSNYFFISLGAAQDYLEMPGGATEWDIRLERPDDLSRVETALQKKLGPEFQVVSWRKQLADVLSFFDLRRKVFVIINAALFLMAVIIVANTMLMTVYERFKEIGTLMALGMKRRQILELFAAEGSLLGLLGGLAGVLIGATLIRYFSTHGVDTSGIRNRGMDINVPIKGKLYAELATYFYFVAVAVSGAVAGLAALWPARKAAGLEPSEALRRN